VWRPALGDTVRCQWCGNYVDAEIAAPAWTPVRPMTVCPACLDVPEVEQEEVV